MTREEVIKKHTGQIDEIVSQDAINQVKELQDQLSKAISLQQKLNSEMEKYNALLLEKIKLEQI